MASSAPTVRRASPRRSANSASSDARVQIPSVMPSSCFSRWSVCAGEPRNTARHFQSTNATWRHPGTEAIFSLGGATMDNEWNYAHLKLWRALGLIWLENQARI